MQRPKRPGRYHHDPVWDDNSSRPGTPTPGISDSSRIRNRYEYFRRTGKTCPRRQARADGWGAAREYYDYHAGECSMVYPDQVLPPRPAPPPPPPASVHQEPLPGPSTSEEQTSEMMTRLLSVLECPVCFDYVSPPILQCREGHLVCSGCRARLDLCPKCRQPFADIRARALEQVAEVVRYPCYNSGCGAMLPLTERHAHENICPYRQYQCSFEPCSWAGKRSSLPEHMTHNHPTNFVSSSTHEIVLTLTHHEEKIFLMQCYDEIFHCVMGVDRQQDIFVGFVMHLGPREKASDFLFEIKFKRDYQPFTQITVMRTALPESALGTQISGINAIVVSFATLREMIREGDNHTPILPVYISIRKHEQEGRGDGSSIAPTASFSSE